MSWNLASLSNQIGDIHINVNPFFLSLLSLHISYGSWSKLLFDCYCPQRAGNLGYRWVKSVINISVEEQIKWRKKV